MKESTSFDFQALRKTRIDSRLLFGNFWGQKTRIFRFPSVGNRESSSQDAYVPSSFVQQFLGTESTRIYIFRQPRKKIRIFLSTCLRSNVFCLTILREQETRIFWFPSIRISKRESILSKPFLTFQHLLFTKLLGSENVNLSLPSMKKEKKVKLQQAYQTHPLKIH